VKEGYSKKQLRKYFSDSPSDCKMDEVPVQEDSPISDTTPISKSIIYGEDGVQSDCKKAAPSIEGHSPFSEPSKSKGLMDEEVQFVMSQIDLLSKKESGTKKRKTEVPTQRSQLTTSKHLQIFLRKEASFFLKLQYTVATARNKVV
jgi:hypothetical protein